MRFPHPKNWCLGPLQTKINWVGEIYVWRARIACWASVTGWLCLAGKTQGASPSALLALQGKGMLTGWEF